MQYTSEDEEDEDDERDDGLRVEEDASIGEGVVHVRMEHSVGVLGRFPNRSCTRSRCTPAGMYCLVQVPNGNQCF